MSQLDGDLRAVGNLGVSGSHDVSSTSPRFVEAGGAGETGRAHGYFRVSEHELDLGILPVPQSLDDTVEAISVDPRAGWARRACLCHIFQRDSRDCCRGSDVSATSNRRANK